MSTIERTCDSDDLGTNRLRIIVHWHVTNTGNHLVPGAAYAIEHWATVAFERNDVIVFAPGDAYGN